MKTNRIPRGLFVLGAFVVALAALGYVFRDGTGVVGDTAAGVGDSANDEALYQVEAVLGRDGALVDDAGKAAESASTAGGANLAPPEQSAPTTVIYDDGRKIVQTASLKLQVEGVGESFEEVSRIATAAGGFVARSSFSNVGDSQQASVTIRVPASRHQEVLSQLRGLAKTVDSEVSGSDDVSEEYADLSSRLRNLEATEAQLLALMSRANTIDDILTVQDRLNDVRSQIEQAQGRIQLLDNLTEMTTVSVHLRPVVVPGNGGGDNGSPVNLGDKVSEAWDDSIRFLSEIAGGVVTVVVFAWWLPLAAIPAWAVLRRLAAASRPRDELADGQNAGA